MSGNKTKGAILAGIAILMLLYQFVCMPNLRKVREINRICQQKQKDIQTLTDLIQKYKEKTTKGELVFAPDGFNLYLFVSRLLDTDASKTRVSRITPVSENILLNAIEQHISITIEEIELEKLLPLIAEIENRDFLRFGYLQISRNAQKPFVVKADVEIVCYKSKT